MREFHGTGESHYTTNLACRYIQTQAEHHRKVAFQDEFRELMQEAGISIDEQFVWD